MHAVAYDPLQALLVAYHQRLDDQPYFEPLRALPLNQRVQMSPSQFVLDRMVEVLDAFDRMLEQDQAVQVALNHLPSPDRDLVLHLAAYGDSRGQFDWKKASEAWTLREWGICAHPYPDAFRKAQSRRRAFLVQEWEKVRSGLFDLLIRQITR